MRIELDDLRGPEIAALLQHHLDDMAKHSPPESCHALDLSELQQPDVSFWCMWDGDQLAGCGALKALHDNKGEIKSMRTADSHLRRGVAAQLLRHILKEAKNRGYQQLNLETGSMQAFAPARLMYQKFGFEFCEPFGDYKLDPNSLYMKRTL